MRKDTGMSGNEKSIIIIGGGVSGLAAGCYAGMNGYKANIFEMHNIPGGLCTSWKRKGYTFDFCIDWMGGLNPDELDHNIWRELGVLKNKKKVFFEEFLNIRDRDGRYWKLYADPEKLRVELLKLTYYDEDKEKINSLCDAIGNFIKSPAFSCNKPDILQNRVDMLKMAFKYKACFKDMMKYSTTLIRDFYNSIKDPRLKEIVRHIYLTPDIPFCMIPPIYTLTNLYKKNMGYPEGGSMELARSLEARFKGLGGEIQYRAKVKKILVENNKAIGIQLEDDSLHYAGNIISACDAYTTIYKLLEGKYINNYIEKMYKEGSVCPSMLRVYLGVDMDFKDQPDNVVYKLNKLLEIPGLIQKDDNSMLIRHYCNTEPAYAPPGKSVLVGIFLAEYDYWKEISGDRELYLKAKEKAASEVIRELENIYPGIGNKIEVTDVTTPITIERYTGNYKGSIQGFVEDETRLKEWLNKAGGMTMTGLENFYMIGQWVTLQGLLRVAGGGRYAIENLCKKEGRKFITQTA